jgi:hypothetical protein
MDGRVPLVLPCRVRLPDGESAAKISFLNRAKLS